MKIAVHGSRMLLRTQNTYNISTRSEVLLEVLGERDNPCARYFATRHWHG